MRCFVEPSPAGGYFVRLRGEPVPVSRHDTEEEAEAAAAAYERGLSRTDTAEHVVLDDGSEVLIRAAEVEHVDHDEVGAFAAGERVGVARFARDDERPHLAAASVTVDETWRGRGLEQKLLRRLRARASESGIRAFTVDGRIVEDAVLLEYRPR